MMAYQIEFWRGDVRVRDFEREDYWTVDEAVEQVSELLHAMMDDPSMEDWTGCWFEIARDHGVSIVQIPVVKALGFMARHTGH
jgi:hypothetical protein